MMVFLAGLAHYFEWGAVSAFAVAAVAVTLLATLVGRSVEQLGDRFGPGATGVLQSALGNLPELFIAIFALRAGLVDVVKAALIGSVLANEPGPSSCSWVTVSVSARAGLALAKAAVNASMPATRARRVNDMEFPTTSRSF